MGAPHKYADVIKAWADGEEIQFRYIDEPAHWFDYSGRALPALNNENLTWRIKPKKRWCRVALMRDAYDGIVPVTAECEADEDEAYFYADSAFVKWLTDRIEYEL